MSQAQVSSLLVKFLASRKVRLLIEGPPLSGKTQIVLGALRSSNRPFVHLTPLSLYSNPVVSPASLAERAISSQSLIFLDDADTIFPARDSDLHFLNRFLSLKPALIAACRISADVHPFLQRFCRSSLRLEARASLPLAIPRVTFSDVGGASRAKSALALMASWCVRNASRVSAWGIAPPSGAVLFGPPGTGKTLLAKAAANACGCCFFSLAIPELLACEVGESEKRLTRAFESARASAPAIVFVDEVQALFGRRGESKSDANRLVAQLIAQLDANGRRGAVFSLAATNALAAVDPALLQPGRFEEVIEVALPDADERREILEIALREVKHAGEVAERAREIAAGIGNASAADIVGVCQRAAVRALAGGREEVGLQDLRQEVALDAVARQQAASNSVKSTRAGSWRPT